MNETKQRSAYSFAVWPRLGHGGDIERHKKSVEEVVGQDDVKAIDADVEDVVQVVEVVEVLGDQGRQTTFALVTKKIGCWVQDDEINQV